MSTKGRKIAATTSVLLVAILLLVLVIFCIALGVAFFKLYVEQDRDVESLEESLDAFNVTVSGLYREWSNEFSEMVEQINATLKQVQNEYTNRYGDVEISLQQINTSLEELQGELDDMEFELLEQLGNETERLGDEVVENRAELDQTTSALQNLTLQAQQLDASVSEGRLRLDRDMSLLMNLTLQAEQLDEVASENRESLYQANASLQLLGEGFADLQSLYVVSSCAALPSSSLSGHYLVNASDGGVVRVYCDMTLSCGGGVTGGWTRVAELDTTRGDHRCPDGLQQRTDSDPLLRTCVRSEDSPGCSSVRYPASSIPYEAVCGRIIAYQVSSPDAFASADENISGTYVDGVSLTHGHPRQHIWTFAAAISEDGQNMSVCPCTLGQGGGAAAPPPFVSADYFCDTGFETLSRGLARNDTLWDGEGCSAPTNTCCDFNTPPWFYRELPRPSTDDIEVRVCRDEGRHDEDVALTMIDIYIR